MSVSVVRLPPWRMMLIPPERVAGRDARSRQISAMMAVAGRRISAAISAGVGQGETCVGSRPAGRAAACAWRVAPAAMGRGVASRRALPRSRSAASAVARSRPRVMGSGRRRGCRSGVASSNRGPSCAAATRQDSGRSRSACGRRVSRRPEWLGCSAAAGMGWLVT